LFLSPVPPEICYIDHFKKVNDPHGHGVGDVVLREAADRGVYMAKEAGRNSVRFAKALSVTG
jgi:GGDEF domain-containing protein